MLFDTFAPTNELLPKKAKDVDVRTKMLSYQTNFHLLMGIFRRITKKKLLIKLSTDILPLGFRAKRIIIR